MAKKKKKKTLSGKTYRRKNVAVTFYNDRLMQASRIVAVFHDATDEEIERIVEALNGA